MDVTEIVGATPHQFERFRQTMDASVGRSAAVHVLRTAWHGATYRVTAPGVLAIGRYENGNVHVRVTLSFPATLLRRQILNDIMRSMREAGCEGVRSS